MESIKKASSIKLITILLSYVMAYLYVDQFYDLVKHKTVGAIVGTIIFTLGFVLWNELIMYVQRLENKFKVSAVSLREARFWEVILILLSGLTHFGAEADLIVFAMHIVVVYMVLCGSGHLFKNESSIYLPGDLINGFIRIPFGNITARVLTVYDSVKALARGDETESGNARLKKVVIALISAFFILVAIVIFWIVFGLLAELDEVFNSAFVSINKAIEYFFINLSVIDVVGAFIISIPVGAYLGGLFLGSVRHNYGFENNLANKIDANYKRLKVIPALIFYIVSAMFIVMYLLFFISQSRFLFSGFAGIVPDKLTASQYAVEGFEQLATVLIINFMGLGVMRLFSSKSVVDSRLTAAGSILLMVTSMVFAVISASKIILYITRFGYTPLRFESMWFTVAAFAGAALSIYNIATSKKVFKFWLFFSAITFVIMNVVAGICSVN